MSQPKQLLIAADADFILQIQAGIDPAIEAYTLLRRIRGFFVATPCVIQELSEIAERGGPIGDLAANALACLGTQLQIMAPPCDGLANGLAHMFAEELVRSGELSEDKYDDGLCLAQASLIGARLLVTNQPEFSEIKNLEIYFIKRDLNAVHPINVTTIKKFFDGAEAAAAKQK